MDWLFQGAFGSKSLSGTAVQGAEHGLASALPALCPAAGAAVSAASAAVLLLPAGIKPGFICAPTAGTEPAHEGLGVVLAVQEWVPGMGPMWDGPWLTTGSGAVTLCSNLGHVTVPWPWDSSVIL